MKLTPKEFVLLLEDAAPADGVADGEGEYEAEFADEAEAEGSLAVGEEGEEEGEEGLAAAGDDGDGDVEVELPDSEDEEDEDEIDWSDIFGDEWNAPKPGELDAAKDIAEKIGEGVHIAEEKNYPDRGPYMPHPGAARGDQIRVYEEGDPSLRTVYHSASEKVRSESRAIASQLRRVLFSRSLSSTQRDQRRGRLDRRKLHTIASPGTLGVSKRIFKRQIEGKGQDIAIGVLVDQSGSMRGEKIRHARSTAIALGDALDQLTPLGVKFGVWGFDMRRANSKHLPRGASRFTSSIPKGKYDRYESLKLHWYKGLTEEWRHVAPRIGGMRSGNNNCDGECIRWAAQQLLEADAERRVLFVLSDGQPSCITRDYGRLVQDTKRAVAQCESAGVEMVGIGFQSKAVQNYYKRNVVVYNSDGLGPKVLTLIAESFSVRSLGASRLA